MTHDELLAKINEPEHWFKPFLDMRSALRAVVELHQPFQMTDTFALCDGCGGEIKYPCPTIQAIQEQLK